MKNEPENEQKRKVALSGMLEKIYGGKYNG